MQASQPPQLRPIDQFLVAEAERVQLGDAHAAGIEFGVVLGDQHLAVAFEAAGIVDQLVNPLPNFHRADRERDLGDMPRELTNAAGIHP